MVFLEEYTLLDELGQGGYATVYKVRHNKLGYIRAVRVLNSIIAHGEEDKTYQKFLEECRLLLRLGNGNHPNIVHIYQPLLKAQRAIVEMDFVDGKDLFHFLEEKDSFVETKDVLRLLTDIGSALSYCHEDIYKFCMDKEEDNLQDDPNDGRKALVDARTKDRLVKKYRVIHNDIHSGNIIRREDGSFVLLDFGLAIEGDSVVRSSRKKNGAPEFKAPEKWDNEAALTTQSDIYSFGIVLYEFLTGRVPFVFDKKKSNPIEAEYLLSKAHKEQTPPSVYELRKAAFENSHPDETYEKDYPDWLEELIMKCLAKSTDDRFKNGKELYTFVQEHISSETEAEIQELQTQVALLQNNIALLEKEGQNTIDLQNRINRLEKENSKLEKTISELEESHSDTSDPGTVINFGNNSNDDADNNNDRIEELDAELQNAYNNLDSANEQLAGLKIQNEELVKENRKLMAASSNNKPGSSRRSPLFIITTLIFFIAAAVFAYLYFFAQGGDNSNYSRLQEENKKLRKTIYDLTKENNKFTEDIENKDFEISGLQDKIASLQKEVEAKNDIVAINPVYEYEKEIVEVESDNDKYLKSVINDKDKTISGLRAEVSRLENDIKKKESLINILNERLGI